MTRWITFDNETAELLRNQFPQETRIEAQGRNAVEFCLAAGGSTVAILPGGQGGVTLALFQRNPRWAEPLSVADSKAQERPGFAARAGGFLGLVDEPILEEEVPREKKSWWRKLRRD